MEYKGYVAKAEYDDSIGVLHGRVINTRDVITFEATSVDMLRREFESSVDDYLAMCAERGEEPEKPYSGNFLVRSDPELHRAIARAASREGKSVNAWVAEVLARAVGLERPGADRDGEAA